MNNQYLIYDLFKPKIASKENKAPFIAIIPGLSYISFAFSLKKKVYYAHKYYLLEFFLIK